MVWRVPAKETNQLMNTEKHSEVLVYWLTCLGWTKLRVTL